MIIKRLSLIVVVAVQLIGTANAQTPEFTVLVPYGTVINGGPDGDVGVLLGRPMGGVDDVGSCYASRDNPIVNVVLVGPYPGSIQATLIVLAPIEPLHAGMQLTQFEALGGCTGPEGRDYMKYKVNVEPRHTDPSLSTIEFLTPFDTRIISSGGVDVGIVLGRALGTVNGPLLECAGHGSFPLHNVVLTHPGGGGGSTVATVIVTAQEASLSPGMRFEDFVAITACTSSDGLIYMKYRAAVRPVAGK